MNDETHSPIRYERVTYKPEGKRARHIFLKQPSEKVILGEDYAVKCLKAGGCVSQPIKCLKVGGCGAKPIKCLKVGGCKAKPA